MDLGRQSPLGSARHPTAFCIKGDFLLRLFTPLNFFQVKPGEFFQVFTFLEGGEEAEPSTRSVQQLQSNTKISFTTRPPLENSILGGPPCSSRGPSSRLCRHRVNGSHSLIWACTPWKDLGCILYFQSVLVPSGPGPRVSVTCPSPPPPRSSGCLKRKQSRFQGATGRQKS